MVPFFDNRADIIWSVLAPDRLVNIGILPKVNFTKLKRGAKPGISVCSRIIRLTNNQTKSPKRTTIPTKEEKVTIGMLWKLYHNWVASLLEIKCILHAVVTSLCGLGSCLLVWHMHSVCLLHGHVAHSSHSAEELDSRFASEWETHHLPLSWSHPWSCIWCLESGLSKSAIVNTRTVSQDSDALVSQSANSTRHKYSTFTVAQHTHISSREHAWFKMKDCASACPWNNCHPRVMSCSLPHLTLTTSTSSLSTVSSTSPVFPTVSSTHTRSMVLNPYIPCDSPRQSGGSTQIPSFTGWEPKSVEFKVIETEAIEPADLEPRRIELERSLGTGPYQIQERFMLKFLTEDVDGQGDGVPRLASNMWRRTCEGPEPACVHTHNLLAWHMQGRKGELTSCRGTVKSAWQKTSSETRRRKWYGDDNPHLSRKCAQGNRQGWWKRSTFRWGGQQLTLDKTVDSRVWWHTQGFSGRPASDLLWGYSSKTALGSPSTGSPAGPCSEVRRLNVQSGLRKG